MNPLVIKLTDSTPSILLDPGSGKFEITGRSLPEEATGFYQPILEWISEYMKNPNKSTNFRFMLDYINSASIRAINEIFVLLERFHKTGHDVKVLWQYNTEDPELKETGEEFSEIYKIPFIIEVYHEKGNRKV